VSFCLTAAIRFGVARERPCSLFVRYLIPDVRCDTNVAVDSFRNLRAKAAVPHDVLASELGVGLEQVLRWEIGENRPPKYVIAALTELATYADLSVGSRGFRSTRALGISDKTSRTESRKPSPVTRTNSRSSRQTTELARESALHRACADYDSHMREKLSAISLFSSGGIGDLALRACGVQVLVANELLTDRAEIFSRNFPDCEMLAGDIRQLSPAIIAATRRKLAGRALDVLFATPPCQGMSKNGRGKLLSNIRAGMKPELDERNQLILNVIDIALELRPRLIVLENVPEMRDTLIEVQGRLRNIIELLHERLEPEYAGQAHIVEFADYGVPQRRQRLITVFSRDASLKEHLRKGTPWLPEATHSRRPTMWQRPWVTVEDAIHHLEPLDARSTDSRTSSDPFHRVPLLDADKYFWVSNTPPGKGAFDNQCVNPVCGFDGNPTHGAKQQNGINQANKCTPVRCGRCGELLPRPWVKRDGEFKIMSGFTSAYKRMRADLPASALTRNLSYACSDQKLHYSQHRVLSLKEAFILHTIADYPFSWERQNGRMASDKTIRDVIGESIPPRGLRVLFDRLVTLLDCGAERLVANG
jgi:DNA (cytosine-5)-methyltransferase 1